MLKKLFLILLSAILFAGCRDINSDKTVVTFSTWGSITEINVLKTIISEFEKENPNVKIHLIHIPQNYFQKLHLLFASNTAPDVVFINNLNLPIYEKYLEDLTNYINNEDFYPVSTSALSYDKKLLAIPRDISNLVFYVNLEKADLPNTKWSLDNLLQKSKSYTDKNSFAISFEDDIYWALPYLSYFGETNLIDGISKEELDGINFYKSLRDEYKIAPTNANPILKLREDIQITTAKGGDGAIREVVDTLLNIEEAPKESEVEVLVYE